MSVSSKLTASSNSLYSDWIHSNNVEAFVILDDESFDFNDLGLSEHFVKTSFYKEDGGLQEEHVKSAIKILNEVM